MTSSVVSGRVAFLLDDLRGGGVQRNVLLLAQGLLNRGHQVDILACRAEGAFLDALPKGARLVPIDPVGQARTRLDALLADPGGLPVMLRPVLLPLKGSDILPYARAVATYLRRERPDALMAATPFVNLAGVWARKLGRASTRVVVSEQSSFAGGAMATSPRWRHRYLRPLLRRAYGQADTVIAACGMLADEMASELQFPRQDIDVIWNPIVGQDLLARRDAPVAHPWFHDGGPPVILGAGRLDEQKDFPTLLRAFAHLRRELPARLVILGNGRDHADTATRTAELRALAAELGVADEVDLPGFVANPPAFMAQARLFVLSSIFEGFGNVLVEAMACGCPVVSTNCPVGPAEILENGKWGPLVRVGDAQGLAAAMRATLADPPSAEALRGRADCFPVEGAIDRYEAALLPGRRLA